MYIDYTKFERKVVQSEADLKILDSVIGYELWNVEDTAYARRKELLKLLKSRRNEIPKDIYKIIYDLDYNSGRCTIYQMILSYTKGYLDSSKGQAPIDIIEFANIKNRFGSLK